MKKSISFILVMLMVLCMVPGVALAEEKTVSDQPDLNTAITNAVNNDVIIIKTAGTYELPVFSSNKTLTIKAADGVDVTFDNIGAKNLNYSNVTFENITFDYYPNALYTGLQHSGELTYKNCTINGQVFLYGSKEVFNNCTFNQNSADDYNVWTYGAEYVEFNGCTFNCAGKSVLVYNEGGPATELIVKGTKFIATSSVEGKAAIEIDTRAPNNPGAMDGTLIVIDDKTTDTGFDKGSVSGETLWNDKRDLTNLEVWVAGTQVWPKYVAKIGDKGYASLKAAMDAAAGMTGDVTIELLDDVEWKTGATIGSTPFFTTTGADANRTITIEGNGKTFTATGDGVGNIGLDNGKVIFKNLTIQDDSVSYAEGSWEYGYLEFRGDAEFENCTFVNAIMMEGENAKFTDCKFKSKKNEYDVWVANGNATFTDCTFEGYRGLKIAEAYGTDTENILVEGCTFKNLSEKPGIAIGCIDNGFVGCGYCYDQQDNIYLNPPKRTTITIKNSHFMNCQRGDQNKYAYETDTDVTKFNFTFGKDNHICYGANNTDWQTLIEPTATKDGLKAKLCLNNRIDVFASSTSPISSLSTSPEPELCHYIVEKEIIPALGGGTTPTPTPKPTEKPASSGIKVEYNGGNSFSTSKGDVPTSVEIDGVPVPFTGNGSSFTVGCIDPNAKWVTVKWNSTTVTVNFTPDVNVVCTEIGIPKTGDMPFWAAIAEFLGF